MLNTARKYFLILATALLPGLVASSAMAGSFYGAVDVGGVEAADACNGLPGFSCTNSEVAYRIAAGYQFDPIWGVELSYGDMGSSKLSGATSGAAINQESKISTAQVAATGTYRVTQAFSMIGKVGIATTFVSQSTATGGPGLVASSTANATSTRLAYGIGAQFDITKTFSVRAQYEALGNVGNASTGTSEVALISAGVVQKF